MTVEPDGVTQPVIEQVLARELDRHRGKWVAVDRERREIVGIGESATEAKNDALAKGVTDPLIFRVSAHPDRIAFL